MILTCVLWGWRVALLFIDRRSITGGSAAVGADLGGDEVPRAGDCKGRPAPELRGELQPRV